MDPTELMTVEGNGMIQDMFPARDFLKAVKVFYSSQLVEVYEGNKLTLPLHKVSCCRTSLLRYCTLCLR